MNMVDMALRPSVKNAVKGMAQGGIEAVLNPGLRRAVDSGAYDNVFDDDAEYKQLWSKLKVAKEGASKEDKEVVDRFFAHLIGEAQKSSDGDEALDNLDTELSDEQLKVVERIRPKLKLSKDDVRDILRHFPHPDKNKHTNEAHKWRGDVLDGYIKHIKNYVYHYKPEAQKVGGADPKLDPSVEHIGPMAQDIEKVNPAAVNTDKKTGYKSVDTGRLALMNAGAIAELAKKVDELMKE